MKEKNELDILIPVFNEGETIVKTIKNILSVVKCNYKILICYDYDEDPTLEIIKENFPNDQKIIFVKKALKKGLPIIFPPFINLLGQIT